MSQLLTWRRFTNYTAASHHLHLQSVKTECSRFWMKPELFLIKLLPFVGITVRRDTHTGGGRLLFVLRVLSLLLKLLLTREETWSNDISVLRVKSVYSNSLPSSCYNLRLHPPSSPRRHHHSHPPVHRHLASSSLSLSLSLSVSHVIITCCLVSCDLQLK